MKNKIFPACAIALITVSACGQKMDASKVPAAVKSTFVKQFQGVTPKWEKEGAKFEAGFLQDGLEMSAVFDANGNMEESEMEINVNVLPPVVLNYIKTHYSGLPVKEAAKITKSNGEINYEAAIKGRDLIFDSSGNFIKEAKD